MQRRSGYRRQVGLHSAFGGTSSSAVRERPVAGPVYVLGASALAPLRSSPRGLQPLLLDKVHNRHDRGRLRQLDAELLHDRPEVVRNSSNASWLSQASKTWSWPSSPKHEWSFIALSGAPASRRRSALRCAAQPSCSWSRCRSQSLGDEVPVRRLTHRSGRWLGLGIVEIV